MKKLLSILTALMLACALPAGTSAEQAAEETQYKEIFTGLAYIYDAGLDYLHHYMSIRSELLARKTGSDNSKWFYDYYFLTSESRRGPLLAFMDKNGLDAENLLDRDDLYQRLFMPVYSRTSMDDEGFAAACLAFTYLVYYDTTLPEKLEVQKTLIKQLKAARPDYEYMEDLQSFYRRCSQLLGYIGDSTDNYLNLSEQVSEFEKIRREIKSIFEFDFDWPVYSCVAPVLSDEWKDIYDSYRAKMERENEAARLAAESEAYREKHTYGSIYRFSNGMACVSRNGKYGFIDFTGNLVIPCQFGDSNIPAFEKDVPYVIVRTDTAKKGGKYGVIGKTGEALIPCQMSWIDFGDGLFLVRDSAGRTGYMDLNGEWAVQTQKWDDARVFSNGYAPVKRDGKWGLMDKNADVVLACKWRSMAWYGEYGIAVVQNDKGLYGSVARDGKTVIPCKYENVISYGWGDIALFTMNDGSKAYIDLEGNIISGDWSACGRFSEGLACVSKNDRYGFINRTGEVVIPCEFDRPALNHEFFSDGLAAVAKDGKYGYIDPEGTLAIPCEWDKADEFNGGTAVVKSPETGNYGVIDREGKLIIPCEYTRIENGDGYIACSQTQYFGGSCLISIFDKEGNLIF